MNACANLKCPQCQRKVAFCVKSHHVVTIAGGNVTSDNNLTLENDDECTCQTCEYTGPLKSFKVHEYLFDVKVDTSLRIEAGSEQEARRKLAELLDCATTNFGAIDDVEVVGEASMNGEAYIVEVDGETV